MIKIIKEYQKIVEYLEITDIQEWFVASENIEDMADNVIREYTLEVLGCTRDELISEIIIEMQGYNGLCEFVGREDQKLIW